MGGAGEGYSEVGDGLFVTQKVITPRGRRRKGERRNGMSSENGKKRDKDGRQGKSPGMTPIFFNIRLLLEFISAPYSK